jgi:hypothetical protein
MAFCRYQWTKRQVDKCEAKVRFERETDARMFMQKKKIGSGVRVYQCRWCEKFHLSSKWFRRRWEEGAEVRR